MRNKYQKFHIEKKCVYIFVIKETISGKYIGVRNLIFDNIEFGDLVYFNPNSNIITETAINKNYWRNGYATESSEEIFNFLKRFDFENILTFVTPRNIKAQNHVEKLDFKKINFSKAVQEYKYTNDIAKHTFDIEEDYIYVRQNI